MPLLSISSKQYRAYSRVPNCLAFSRAIFALAILSLIAEMKPSANWALKTSPNSTNTTTSNITTHIKDSKTIAYDARWKTSLFLSSSKLIPTCIADNVSDKNTNGAPIIQLKCLDVNDVL